MKNNDWKNEWVGMPEFVQEEKKPFAEIKVRFETESDLNEFANLIGQQLTPKTKSIWHPYKSHWGVQRKVWSDKGDGKNPSFPIYIVSKGRYDNMLTAKALDEMRVPYRIVVEESEYERYSSKWKNVLVLPQSYLDSYDTCDNLGSDKSKGPGAARNFCWDHSVSNGYDWHWVMDDNIDAFHRLHDNVKDEVSSGTILKCAEDFTLRYQNIAISGLNYYSFCKSTDKVPPFVLNTRIYSCLFINNSIPYRWRGRYNEDTDICLRVLKDGWCTLQFNAFLCGKVTTQRMKGGNTQEFYSKEGTLNKSKMLADLHPDVAKVVWRFNRWHHTVNYKPFRDNKLIPVSGFNSLNITDNYDMILKNRDKGR